MFILMSWYRLLGTAALQRTLIQVEAQNQLSTCAKFNVREACSSCPGESGSDRGLLLALLSLSAADDGMGQAQDPAKDSFGYDVQASIASHLRPKNGQVLPPKLLKHL